MIPADIGNFVIAAYRHNAGNVLGDEAQLALACRYTLQVLKREAPGKSVEVRVPPYGAVQVIAGPAHTRGTPPSVIEMTPSAWLALALGDMRWEQAVASGVVDSSGYRANLQQWLPLSQLG